MPENGKAIKQTQPVIESIEWTMWRFEPDLSYVPEPKQ